MIEPHLVVVLPVFNEAACISEVIYSWQKELIEVQDLHSHRFVIVDDGSTDNTSEILYRVQKEIGENTVLMYRQVNAGHGNAVLNGYRYAQKLNPGFVFQTDTDNQFIPQDFRRLWIHKETSDVILGYRKKRNDPAGRLIITRILRFLIRLRFGVNIPDANIPYRLMRSSWLTKNLDKVPENSIAPNIFLSILAAKQNILLCNVPVEHRERESGNTVLVNTRLLSFCIKCFTQLYKFKPHLRNDSNKG